MGTIRIRAPGHELSRVYNGLVLAYREKLALQTASLGVLALGALFALTLTLDTMLWLEPSTRVLYWLCMAACVGAAAAWVLRHIGRVRVERRVLHLVDRAWPELQGAFVAGLQFAQKDPADWERFSPALLLAAVRTAEQQVRGRDLRPALAADFGGPRLARLVAGAAAVAVILLGVSTLSAVGRAHALRTLLPFFDWGNHRMTVSPGDVQVLAGESVRIEARLHVPVDDEVLCLVRSNQETWTSHPMKKEGDAFAHVVPAIWKATEYQVVYGMTESRVSRIDVVSAPRVQAQRRRLRFPAYLGRAPEDETEWGPGTPVRVPRGTMIAIDARANAPIAGATLAVEAGGVLTRATCAVDGDGVTIHTSLYAEASGVYRFLLDDPAGRKDPDPPQYTLDVIDDPPPEVRLLGPDPDVQVARNGVVSIPISARDDHGVSSLLLAARVERGEAWNGLPGYASVKEPERVLVRVSVRSAELRARIELRLWELFLAPGDRLVYRVGALDDDDHFGPGEGWSEERAIRVVQPQRGVSQTRQRLRNAQRGYDDLVARALAVRNAVQEAREELSRRREMTPETREALKTAAAEQGELVHRMSERAEELERTAQELDTGDREARKQAEELRRAAADLRDVARKEMSEARDELAAALSKPEPGNRMSLLTAEDRLDRAIERLKDRGQDLKASETTPERGTEATAAPPERLEVDPDFVRKQTRRDEARSRLEKLAERAAAAKARQEEIAREAEELQRSIEKGAEETLSPEDREDLERLATKAGLVKEDLDRLRQRHEDLAREADEVHAKGDQATPSERRAVEEKQAALEAESDRMRERWEEYRAEKERLGLQDAKSEAEFARAAEDLETDQHRASQEWKKGDTQRSTEARKAVSEDLDRLARESDEDFQQASEEFREARERPPLTAEQHAKARELAKEQEELNREMDDLARESDEIEKKDEEDDLPLETDDEAREAAEKGRLAAEAMEKGDVGTASEVMKEMGKEASDVDAATRKDQKTVEEKKRAEEQAYAAEDAKEMEKSLDEMQEQEQEIAQEEQKNQQGQSGDSTSQGQGSSSSQGQGSSSGQGSQGSSAGQGSASAQGSSGSSGGSQGGSTGQGGSSAGSSGGQAGSTGQSGSSAGSSGGQAGSTGQGGSSAGSSGGQAGSTGQSGSSAGSSGSGSGASGAGGDPRAQAAREAGEVKARADRIASVSSSEAVDSAATEAGARAEAYGQAAREGAGSGELARRRDEMQRAVDQLDEAISQEGGGPGGDGAGSGGGGGGSGRGGRSDVAATESLVGGRGGGGAIGAGAGRVFVGEEAIEGQGTQLEAGLPPEARGRAQEGRRVDPPPAFRRQVEAYFKAILEER